MNKSKRLKHNKNEALPGFTNETAREVLKKFRVLFGTVKQHYRDVEDACGLGGAQLWALIEISQAPGLRVSELATALLVHQSTASNLVDKIEKLGFVAKKRIKGDQRVVQLFLTKKGSQVISLAPEPGIGVLPDAIQRLSVADLNQLDNSMSMLLASMRIKDVASAGKPLANL